MQSLAPVAARFGVTVSVVEPAAVATHMADGLDTRALFGPDDPYREPVEKFLRTAQSEMANAQSAQAAAAVVVEAATTDSPASAAPASADLEDLGIAPEGLFRTYGDVQRGTNPAGAHGLDGSSSVAGQRAC
ncbi:hypothetical protein AB0I49_34715 [Streptomyces sp. NPDC050617]|uniref:hypothetical protein n=1 Tax=Streptomyces sp. NPDC050617 TaxID=3154628 RepID=UPI00343F3B4A